MQEIAAGAFREDLYYRLNVVPIHLPPLRERREDIPLLVEHFIAKFNERLKKQIAGIVPEAVERAGLVQLAGQHPRAREPDRADDAVLRGAVDPAVRSAVGGHGGLAGLAVAPLVAARGAGAAAAASAARRRRRPGCAADEAARLAPSSLKEAVRAETERVERELIQRALDETGGNVTQAARKLKISRKSLQTKMKELGLRTGG